MSEKGKKSAAKKQAKRGRGRPPVEYRPEFADQAAKLCKLGATNPDIADFFGVSLRTIERWIAEKEEFWRALKAPKDAADERVERSLYQRASGYTYDTVEIFLPKGSRTPVIVPVRKHVPPDVTACIFWLKNRKKGAGE